ncbi:MAG TPA: 1-acyl-sn-glycerol-3-phosphate acyltransferase [Acidimicrobiia bacterium]
MRARTPLSRRLRTVPLLYVATVLAWTASPVIVAVSLLIDLVRWISRRRPFMAVRLTAFLLAYLTAEAVGVGRLFIGWVVSGWGRDPERLRSNAFAIQKWWAGFVFGAVRRIFSLDVRAAGLRAIEDPPFILLSRHASIVDNLLPSHFVSRPHDIHVRYVMKDELVVDPALDIAGNRLPNHFVRRGAGEGDRESAAIRRVAATMGHTEAVLIYPEGTRFTPEKRERALAILERRRPDLHSRASRWSHVLPPRLAGTLALLEGTDADVVILSHRGLDGFARVADIWRGAMVGHRVDVRFERVARSGIPGTRSGRAEWLYDRWEEIDRWVGDGA